MGKYKWSRISQQRLATCCPELQDLANAMLASGEMDLTILCGHRNKKAQDLCVKKGTSKARWPKSKHNTLPSVALDIAPYPVDWEDFTRFKRMVALAKQKAAELGLRITCGADWGWDFPHIQFEGAVEKSKKAVPVVDQPVEPKIKARLEPAEIEADYKTHVSVQSSRFGIPKELILAIIQVESGGVSTAFRYEPRYPYLLNCRTGKPFRRLARAERESATPPADFPFFAGSAGQEWIAQRSSWGLMQVMGANARWLGYQRPYLTGLLSPNVNVSLGAQLLRWYADRALAKRGWAGVCMAYNGGMGALKTKHNTAYAAKVLAALGGAWPEVSPWTR